MTNIPSVVKQKWMHKKDYHKGFGELFYQLTQPYLEGIDNPKEKKRMIKDIKNGYSITLDKNGNFAPFIYKNKEI